jgi:4-amino-4-deoxy-L-arabinose transferase-like glycosyltransferase
LAGVLTRRRERRPSGPSVAPAAHALDFYWILGFTLLGLAFRLRGLVVPTRGIWIDEAFSLWLAALAPLNAMQTIATVDQHPPLYALLLHLWTVFGNDPWWARLSSVLLSTLAIPVAARTAQLIGGSRLARPIAALFAFSPIFVRYAQEVRMYALVILLATLATLFLVSAQLRPRRRTWLALGTANLTLMYTHNVALLLLPAQALYALVVERRRPGFVRPFLATQVGAGALWLPWVPVLIHQTAGVAQRFWIWPPSPGDVLGTTYNLVNAFAPDRLDILGLAVPYLPIAAAALLFSVLAVTGAFAGWRRCSPLFLAILLVPIGLNLALSLWHPIYEERVLLYTGVGALFLVGSGIAAIPTPVGRSAALGLALLCNLVSLNNYDLTFQKEQWQAAAAFLAAAARPGDLVLFNATWAQLPFDYYFRRETGPDLVEHGLPVDLFDRDVLEPAMLPSDVPTIARLTAGRADVWVLLSHDWYNDPQNLIRPGTAALFRRSQTYAFNGLEIIHYER